MSTISGTLIIGDKEYDPQQVLKIGKSGPLIEVNRSEINFDSVYPKIESVDISESFNNDSVIFYKYEGMYIIISGKNKLNEQRNSAKFKGIFTGKLISSPMIKKCRIDGYIFVDKVEVAALVVSRTKAKLSEVKSETRQGRNYERKSTCA